MIKNEIPLLKVFMPKDIAPSVIDTLSSGQVAEGPKVAEFERQLGHFIGNNNVVATNSCSGALLMALQMAGVVSGSEVITTALTCQSTNHPILHLGGKIVWADIQRNTGNIDPQDVEKKITPKTKAIIVMHWGGQPCDMKKLNRIAKRSNVKLIEDAASAFGAEFNNQMIGNHSDFVCFSFQAVKHMTTGDGGALIVQEQSYKERAILLRNNGNNKHAKRTATNWYFEIEEPGWKFHMNDIAATIGIKQLEYQKDLLKKRQNNGQYFNSRLSNVPGLKILKQKPNRLSAYWIYTVLVDEREQFVKHLGNNGIQSGIVHQRNDLHPLYIESKTKLPNLDYFARRMINIPVGWWLEKDQLKYVVEVIKKGWRN
jgi:perosamine synthetase